MALQTLLLHQLLHAAAQTGDVGLGGGEVVVHDDAVSRLDKPGGQNILTGAALMGGQAVLDAEQLLQFCLHFVEGLRSGVGVVGHQHGGLLPVRHGVDAGIRQHIQKDILVVQLEGIEPGVLYLLQPLFRRQQVQLLDNFHLVHLHGDGFVFVKRNGGHSALLLEIQNQLCCAIAVAARRVPMCLSMIPLPRVSFHVGKCRHISRSFALIAIKKRPPCPKGHRGRVKPVVPPQFTACAAS